jgi:serine/threonine-protein kinase
VAAQLLRALSYAHRQGVIHRDVKPSNILVAGGGTVKVADFGIARIVEEDGEPGEIVGSARYMSPEQLMGREATPRSDVYSVGILLYHCLTGKPPFSGGVRDLARQHLHEDPAPPRELNGEISPHMEAVILRALAKNPDDRYPSATAMLQDIEAAPRTEKPEGAPRRGRKKWLVLASALALLGGSGALASGYVDLPLPDRDGAGTALSRAEPVETREPPATPEPSREPARERKASSQDPAASQDLVTIPDVRAFFDYFAEERLVKRGFEVRFVYGYQEGYTNRGVTWATDPAIGTRAPEGSTVTVYATPEDYPQPQF